MAALPVLHFEHAAQRLHGGAFQCFLLRHLRQDAGEARRQHALAGAGRAGHQDTVTAGGGDFQRAFGLRLAFHFAHIGVVRRYGLRIGNMARQRIASGQMRGDLQQRLRRIDDGIFHQCGFRCIDCGQNEGASTVGGAIGHRQRAAYRAQFACQR